jgi:hypothetical protein
LLNEEMEIGNEVITKQGKPSEAAGFLRRKFVRDRDQFSLKSTRLSHEAMLDLGI